MDKKLNSGTITNLWLLLDAMTTLTLLPPLLALKGFMNNKVAILTGILVYNLHADVSPPPISIIEAPQIRISLAITTVKIV